MATSVYNNPMFAQSLGGVFDKILGSPGEVAQAELAASKALLNNQTAQYRDDMGNQGLSGDLAAMMVRALQAGPDYSKYAPGIGDAAIRMGALGFGRPELTPQPGSLAYTMMSGGAGRSGGAGGHGSGTGGGGSAGVGARSGYDWGGMSASEQNAALAIARRAVEDGLFPPNVTEADIASALATNPHGWSSLQEGVSALRNPEIWSQGDPIVTDPNEFNLGEIKGLASGLGEIADLFTGPQSTPGPMSVAPPAAPSSTPAAPSGGDEATVLNEARMALKQGASRQAIETRLREMGIDPGRL